MSITPPPPLERPVEMVDTECYRNYWLYKAYDPVTRTYLELEQFDGKPLDRAALYRHLCRARIVTFNGRKYDIPMIACALAGFTCSQLKDVSDDIIKNNLQPWDVETKYGVKIPYDILDHIDIIEVLPGVANQKMYGARMHAKKIQDLPIDPSAILTYAEMRQIAQYCGVDLDVLYGLFTKFKPEIDLRIAMSAEYGIDLRSKSDAQIAEAVFKSQLPQKIYPPNIPAGTQFFYKTPAFIKFKSPHLLAMLNVIERSPFMSNPTGSTSPHIGNTYIDWGDKQVRLNEHGVWVKCPRGWTCQQIRIGNTLYQMGSGGLHSCEHNAKHIADDTYSLQDVDVVSYYPKIISIMRMFPPQIGELFLKTFVGWIEDRIAAKRAGNKRKANGAKTKINGTFGKTGSKYSILFAPSMMIQTTVTGQLALFMLIERLESVPGISVVSANTDGVVIKCMRSLHPVRDAIVKLWEIETGFETEANEYRALFSRDVNSYLAFKVPTAENPRGEVKLKGAFAPPEPVGPSWPNPSNEICVDAIINYILDGTPVERTIRQCSDMTKFVSVRAVKGGGSWVRDTMQATSKAGKIDELTARGWTTDTGFWYEPCGDAVARSLNDAHDHCRRNLPRQYLGKTVRWYYGRGQTGHFATQDGNMVARSEGAKPCMELPDVLPPDINYDWYVREAYDLLADIDCA